MDRYSEEEEKAVRDIRRPTGGSTRQRKRSMMIAGLRAEESIAELCRKEGINQNLYYRWSRAS
jgi:transposase